MVVEEIPKKLGLLGLATLKDKTNRLTQNRRML
jgi:hypothetical protein